MFKNDLNVLKRYGVTEERMPWALFELGRVHSHQKAARIAMAAIGK